MHLEAVIQMWYRFASGGKTTIKNVVMINIKIQWYENFDAWRKAVIESPPEYTKPPWAKWNKYPFLEPFVDFCSTFLLETPTNDWLRDLRPYLYV